MKNKDTNKPEDMFKEVKWLRERRAVILNPNNTLDSEKRR